MLNLDEEQKPPFSPEEIRILGSLMEKQLTTPNNYPLSMNSLMLACNQKSSREPVMTITEGDVGHIARSLVEFGWITIQNSGRTQRVEHKVHKQLKLDNKQQAILAVLMLRQPQTLNEIKVRTERMADFSGPEEIQDILQQWLNSENPLVVCLAPSAGRRENRYIHTLGEDELETTQAELPTQRSNETKKENHGDYQSLLARIDELESRLEKLEALLE